MAEPPEVAQTDWLMEFPPPRSLPLDQEAQRIYERAYDIGLKTETTDNPPVTFTTVVAALLVGEDETSRWFAQQAAQIGPNPAAIFAEKSIDKAAVLKPPPPGKPTTPRLSTDRNLLTISARDVIGNAEGWAHRVGGSDIGVRHLVASYVLNPPAAHRAQMQKWKFQESKWRSEFFDWVAKRYTAEQWTDASRRPAPTKAVPIFEQREVKGASLAFPGDPSTLAILEKAAASNARRNDQWLRMQTVFYALVETARDDAAVREAVLPIWNAVKLVEPQYLQAYDAFFSPSSQSRAPVPFSDLDISPRVLNALETARELAAATQRDANGEFRVGALHLAGALISRRVDGDKVLTTLGLKPQELRVELISHAQQRAESGEVWHEALGEEESLQAGRPVDLNSDEPEAVVRLDEDWTSDPLSIRPDVESFAALLASRNLEPPLSIGLFGPWGSGKTTFLKRLRRAVDRRAAEAKASIDARQQTPYVSNVVHIDFNAWHFAEGALTSSLVDTILRALSSYIKDDKQIAGKAWSKQKLEALESTKRKVEAAKALEDAARTAVTNAQTAVAVTRQKAAAATTSLQAVAQSIWGATKASLQASSVVKDSGVLEAIGDTIKSTDELQARLTAVRSRPVRILSDLGWPRSLLFAGLVLGVPLLIGWLVEMAMGQVGQLISALAATLSVVGLWVRAAAGAVSEVDKAIAQVADEYARRLAEDPGLAKAQADLETAKTNAASAAAGLQAAQQELARAQAEAASATLPAQMLQLVSTRIEDQSYNKELTTLSLARADLEALSFILRDQRGYAAAAAPSPGEISSAAVARAVDRVILYIDDLDRCKPVDVVRVLQMIHMLLAFELFVVVVAVDARWVEEALLDSYEWLARSDGRASDQAIDGGARSPPGTARVTPQDYLEKIFQVSFWLEPMTAARAASYLSSLVRAPVRLAGPVSGFEDGESDISKIEIAGIELDYMRALAAYMGPSPRRVKRLVNAYRLIKARMSDAQLRTFLIDRATDDSGLRSGPYQYVIGLLVIGTGAPSASAHILKELAEWDPREGLDKVVEEFRSRNHSEWTMAAQVIETLMRTQKAKNVSEIRGWARKVGRFLLNSAAPTLRPGGAQPAMPPAQPPAGG
jgi:KAP family P-loop domain